MFPKKKNRQNQQKRPNAIVRQPRLLTTPPENPPPLNSNTRYKVTRRFKAQTGFTSAIIRTTDLFGLMVSCATAASVYSTYNSFQCKRIRIWGTPGTAVNFTWLSPPTSTVTAMGAWDQSYNDVSTGSTYVPRISIKPSPQSTSAMVQSIVPTGADTSNSTGCTFEMECAEFSFVEVVLLVQFNNNIPSIPAIPLVGLTGLNPGQLYCNPLDSSGAGNLLCVSYASSV